MISFLSPEALWLLLAGPLLVAGYVLLMRRRRRVVVRFSTLEPLKEALGPRQSLRRHVPPLLLLLGAMAALLAVARPTATVTLPSDQRTIVMAIDVSLSMRAKDVEPSRIEAAKSAAKAFVQKQPQDTRIGIVTFAGTANLVQPPTHDREALIAAIDRFTLQRATAIGSGLLVALAALFPEEDIDVEKAVLGGTSSREQARALSGETPRAQAKAKAEPRVVPPGSMRSAAIILLTDGRRTTGPNPLEVARKVADHGVRVYAVGFGQMGGALAEVDGYSMFMAFDEPTLQAIAGATQGAYFHAPSAEELAKVYDEITTRFALERQKTEVSALFAALGAALMLVAGALSVLWFRRLG
jgi:Ca-activated chloride channel family protein